MPKILKVLLLVALSGSTACGHRESDAVVAAGMVHLQAAEKLLHDHSGDEKALVVAVTQYRSQHGIDFIHLKQRGEAAVAKLSESERTEVVTQAAHQAEPMLARIRMEAQKYPDSRKALIIVLPLITAGTTRAVATTLATPRGKPNASTTPQVGMPADLTPVRP